MSLDHVIICVPQDKLEDEVKFMKAAFAHIGFKELLRPAPQAVGLGTNKPWYWLTAMKPVVEGPAGNHVGIAVKSREEVDEFYKAAIAAGAKDNGAPGPRPAYGPTYYGAFVISPTGINMEAVHTA